MKRRVVVMAAIVLLCLGGMAQADVLNMGTGLTSLDTVPVGDVGNAGEISGASSGVTRICGAVSYPYVVGKYEVTAAQYTEFLNKVASTDSYGLYNTSMWADYRGCKIQRSGADGSYTYSVASDWANRPVNYVSYWDACRFANWLHNGQPTGLQTASTTEDGAYTLSGYAGNDGRGIQRNGGWRWAVTSEDEWYKAAYYKGGSSNAYWDYPMQSDKLTVPSNLITNPDGGNNANFYQNGWTLGDPIFRTPVGEFENSESHYNTFDQGGNVNEWTEAMLVATGWPIYRQTRGGSTNNDLNSMLADSRGSQSIPNTEYPTLGFRVVSLVPEPSSLLALAGGLVALMGMRRRRIM